MGTVSGVLANFVTISVRTVHDTIQNRLGAENSVAEAFDDTLAERIEERAEEIDSYALGKVVSNWEEIVDDIDTYETVFESEREALDWLINEITSSVGVDLDENSQDELRKLLAKEYADALTEFHDLVAEDETLHREFQQDLNIEFLDRLDSMAQQFERIAGSKPYKLFDFPAEREAILEALLPGEPIPFVDRPEVPEDPEPERLFILGPSGSGKSRIIAEYVKRLPEGAVSHVLVPEKRFLDQSDAQELSHQSFNGDLLLIWEDLHRVEKGSRINVVERTLRELENVLNPENVLYTLLEARSGYLDEIPGTIPEDFENEKSVWYDYEPLPVGSLSETHLEELIQANVARTGEEFEFEESARKELVERTLDSKSAPQYIETAIKTAEGGLSKEEVEQLPADVAGIWREKPYPKLRENSPEEWNVLVSIKILYDLRLPSFAKLVLDVYLDYLGGEPALFNTSVEQLANRQWLTIVGEETLSMETFYKVHHTMLEAIDVSATAKPKQLSELLLDEISTSVPESLRGEIHHFAGTTFSKWDHYSEAKEHFAIALEYEPEYGMAHYNYGTILKDECDCPNKAAQHLETAIELLDDFAPAHHNYATLLHEQLNALDPAAEHYKTALEIDPELAAAHNDYGSYLDRKRDKPQCAVEHFERAIELDPELYQAHINFANTLKEKLDAPEKAAEHLETAISLNPEYAVAHNIYASILADELDEPKKAIEHCETAIKLDPRLAEAHSQYAILLMTHCEAYEKAKEHFEAAIDIDSEFAKAHLYYGNLLSQHMDAPKKAAEHYEMAIELEPSVAKVYYLYAILLHEELDNPAKAARYYESVIEHGPKDAKAHNKYGELLVEELDSPKKAAEHFKTAIELEPNDAEFHNNYAYLHHDILGDLDNALTHYEEAIEIEPEYAQAHVNYAVLLHNEKGVYDKAAHHYQRGIELVPDFLEAHFNYGRLLDEELDKNDKAIEHYKQSLDIWFSSDNMAKIREGLNTTLFVINKFVQNERLDLALEYSETAIKLINEYDFSDQEIPKTQIYVLYVEICTRGGEFPFQPDFNIQQLLGGLGYLIISQSKSNGTNQVKNYIEHLKEIAKLDLNKTALEQYAASLRDVVVACGNAKQVDEIASLVEQLEKLHENHPEKPIREHFAATLRNAITFYVKNPDTAPREEQIDDIDRWIGRLETLHDNYQERSVREQLSQCLVNVNSFYTDREAEYADTGIEKLDSIHEEYTEKSVRVPLAIALRNTIITYAEEGQFKRRDQYIKRLEELHSEFSEEQVREHLAAALFHAGINTQADSFDEMTDWVEKLEQLHGDYPHQSVRKYLVKILLASLRGSLAINDTEAMKTIITQLTAIANEYGDYGGFAEEEEFYNDVQEQILQLVKVNENLAEDLLQNVKSLLGESEWEKFSQNIFLEIDRQFSEGELSSDVYQHFVKLLA